MTGEGRKEEEGAKKLKKMSPPPTLVKIKEFIVKVIQ